MDEAQTVGSAGPALAAHSKDAFAPGQTPASEATADTAQPAGTTAWASARLNQAQDMAKRVSSSLSDTGRWARDTMNGQGGQVANQTMDFIRAQPLAALAVTGAVGFLLGMLVARR